MSKNLKRISIFVICILLLSNLFSEYINIYTEGVFKSYSYQTKNAEFEFITSQNKGRGVNLLKRRFSNFKKKHPEYKDLELFRTYKRNPAKFWNWYAYLTEEKYKYRYLNIVE